MRTISEGDLVRISWKNGVRERFEEIDTAFPEEFREMLQIFEKFVLSLERLR